MLRKKHRYLDVADANIRLDIVPSLRLVDEAKDRHVHPHRVLLTHSPATFNPRSSPITNFYCRGGDTKLVLSATQEITPCTLTSRKVEHVRDEDHR